MKGTLGREKRAEKGKTDGWKIGPYFGKYLKMNLQNIKGQLLGVAAVCVVIDLFGLMAMFDGFGYASFVFPGDGNFMLLLIMMCLLGIFAEILTAMVKLDSEMLYQKPAYIYQSLPVSAFETALAKTIAGAAGIFVADVCALPLVFGELMSDTAQEQGIVHERVMEVLLQVLSVPANAMILSGILLLSIGIGNLMRDSRDKKPKAVFSILVILLIFVGMWCIHWIFENLPGTDGTLGAAVSLIGSVIFAAALLAANTRLIEKRYSV